MNDAAWPLVHRAPPLRPEDVHAWQAPLDGDERLETRFATVLAPEERGRAARFHFPRDRRRFTIARGWLRMFLGEYLGTAPADVPLSVTAFGKPQLAEGTPGDLRFNLAHSDDLALFAFGRGREIGVDLERERADVECDELARRFFSPEEVASLAAMPPEGRRPAFYRCWTRKEAYLKALGFGLQIPLDGFAVTITEPARLIHTAHEPAQRDRWSLLHLSPAAGFAAAIAVEGFGWRLFCGRRDCLT